MLTGSAESQRRQSPARPNCDHDPRKNVTKDFSPGYLGPRESCWMATRLNKVDRDLAVAGPQNTRRNFDNPGEGSRVANRPDAFRTIASKRYKVLRSLKRARQGLTLGGGRTLRS